MKKVLTTASLTAVLVLSACTSGDDDEEKESDTSDGEVEYEDTLAKSDAGDVTINDVLNSIGVDEVSTQTFELTLNNILADKYEDEVDIDAIEDEVNEEIENFGGEEQFNQVLAQSQPGMNVEKYKQAKISNVLHNKYFSEKLDISDEDAVENAYDAQHILIKVDEDGEDGHPDKEAKKEAQKLLDKINDGEDFDSLAQEESEDEGSAVNGGNLGIVTQGQMEPEFEEELFELKPGEVSDLVKTEYGYHIIKRLDNNLDDMSESELTEAKTALVNEKIQDDPNKVMEYYKELLDESNVEFTNDEIKEQVDQMTESMDVPEEGATTEPGDEEME